MDREGRLRPVAYFSKKLSPAESNYPIYNKEMLAIIRAMEEWRGKLRSVKEPFIVLTDYKNLQYFLIAKRLTERQVRWSLILSQFRFRLKFRAGKKAERPDALSRRHQDMPQKVDDERLKNRIVQLVQDEWLPPGYKKERESQSIQEQLRSSTGQLRSSTEQLRSSTEQTKSSKEQPRSSTGQPESSTV